MGHWQSEPIGSIRVTTPMPRQLTIEVDGKRFTADRLMSEEAARKWLIEQAVRLTTSDPLVADKRH